MAEAENEHLRNLTTALDLGAILLDMDLHVTYFTPRVQDLFDLTDEEVGQPLRRVTTNLQGDLSPDAAQVRDTLTPIVRDVKTRDDRWFNVRIFPYRTDAGELEGVVLTFYNITRQKDLESRLRQNEARLRMMMENVEEYAIFTMDAEGTVTTWNTGAQRIFQYESDEIVGQPAEVLFTEEDRKAGLPEAELERLQEQGRIHYTRWHQREDGSRFWADGMVAVLRDRAGEEHGYVRLLRDNTERKQAEEKLIETKEEAERAQHRAEEAQAKAELAQREAEQASRAKSQFLANMSHELRTPLNAVIGYSEMLIEDAAHTGHDDFIPDLTKIRTSGKQLLELINDVLDLSKIEAGQMGVYLETFEVAPTIEEVADTVRPLVRQNDNELVLDVDEELGSMHSDLTKLRQALFNLLSNAAKFTKSGTVTLRVHREAAEDGDWLTFGVSDTGIGMTSEEQERIFDAFSQADASTTRNYGGTGLGLTITRELCHMLGGDIHFESEKGNGSTFRLHLPATSAVEERATLVDTEAVELDVSQEMAARDDLVLVIDDDAGARDLLARHLREEGFRVETAASGRVGIEKARLAKPAVITLDVLMPSMDGWAVLAELKSDPVLGEVPVVMVTFIEDKNMGFTLGATDYMTKPIERDRLLELFQRYKPDGDACPVMIVEDDPATRDLTRRTFEREGCTVMDAVNGLDALERLDEAEKKPRLIFLDLMMPKMDGFEFLDRLRQKAGYRDVPVVVFTAKELTDQDRERLRFKIDRVIQKGPRAREELLSEIRKRIEANLPVRASGPARTGEQ